MYDMKPMAESLASQGRYGDSMLVHMNPIEVAGLRAAAQKMGGDLTTNPQTGQPEAFLPFLLGLGLQGLGMSALGAGIATGIGTAAITGDLGQGALAGLGAFGGAGIGEGLSAAGTAAQASQVTPGVGMDMANAASQVSTAPGAISPTQSLLQDSLSSSATQVGPQSFAPTAGAPLMPTYGPGAAIEPSSIATGFTQPIAPPPPLSSAVTEGTGMALQESLVPPSDSLTGLKSVFSSGDVGTAAREAFMGEVGGTSGLLGTTAAGIAPYAFEQPTLEGMEKQKSLIRPFDYDPNTREFTERDPYAAPGPEYMARGGMVQRLAQGGLTGYKEGNILRGQGDGMSDEIEASIGGEQDVLLSDGEYVIPADAVAMLGNGSTDAGANRLDEMIARLRMKKYGRDKQPPEMKAESVMPT
jgi:hypothetical protein